MTECTRCGERCELFLCWNCGKAIRRLLVGQKVARRKATEAQGEEPGIIWYLDRLMESAYLQTRMGSSSVRTAPDSMPLLPDSRASKLRHQIHAELTSWVKQIAEGRRIRFLPLESVEPDFVGPLRPGWRRIPREYTATSADMARWLAHNLLAIMSEENAAELYDELVALTRKAHRAIDRPELQLFGECSKSMGESDEGVPLACGVKLYAEKGETVVACPRCRSTYGVDELREDMRARARDQPMTGADVLRMMKLAGEAPPPSTFYKVLRRVMPRLYLHADGQRNQHRTPGCKELYAYDDVVAKLNEKPTHRRHERQRRIG
ncbi:hypothetical protein PP568_13180 [Mycobacteroides abscessus]|jgi:predicted RNA-binding Zn-ribbon protein involved in translation (DUF1610 family)|uniref:Helix-turn-helix DNA binding domain protein n=1 Tax=Mycobacteroides abscessus subsp. abscessus TaxID=1185650 RepID=A0AB38D4E6_9MYCO|nr:hypothetical protein [Mycobacteroides abscessus]QSM03240.1 DNA binding protein [Mycobacterium phage prophi102-2]QSM04012.1 DNA binding protein [Mycobacterium phage prophiGD54-1]MBE5420163.1 hypothetical protein [Mycobacteroides abscessus]MBE5455138.1 hypothetical protein [Mycobacteroides abscessus]MBN7296738.1 hypothetical protein [Mycobacteroides abscessus subsp. abscessus]